MKNSLFLFLLLVHNSAVNIFSMRLFLLPVVKRSFLRPSSKLSTRLFGTAETESTPISTKECAEFGGKTIVKSAFCLSTTLLAAAGKASAKGTSCVKLDEKQLLTQTPLAGEIKKRPSDNREYRAVTLKNGIRTLLISDPSTSRSAAAMDVHVGSMTDPKNIPGLAHFCEHMSFLGTSKYPDEDDFSSFLSSNGGSSNAYTDSEDTVYYFDVNAEHMGDALDRFAQFFIAPLFTQSATGRELNAIDSEHSKNINNDGFRIFQLEKDFGNPNHPITKFSTGNKKTLETDAIAQGIDVRAALLDFHRRFYSANLMTLCICSKQDLDTLERWATKCFEAVPNRGTSNPSLEWWGKEPPYLPQQAVTLLEVVPKGEARELSLSWPLWVRIPAERQALDKAKPEMIISHLVGHEGEGSVRAYLVAKGWANSVSCGVDDNSDMQTFDVSVGLTDEGLRHRDEICAVIFAYLQLLRTQVIPEYIYKEVQQLSNIAFNFAEKSDPTTYVSELVAEMQTVVDPSEYLTASRLYDPDPCAVEQYLDRLVPSEARIRVVSKSLQGKTSQVAKYYGTEYNVKALPRQTKEWGRLFGVSTPERSVGGAGAGGVVAGTGGRGDLATSLALPGPNELIPTDFTLVAGSIPPDAPQGEMEAALRAPPILVRNDSTWTVWHKTDRSFAQPKVHVVLSLALSKEKYDAAFVMKSKLFSACFSDSLNEYLYEARLAGLQFQLDFTSRGMQMTFSGFSDKMSKFVDHIVEALKAFVPTADAYKRFKDLLSRELASWKTQQPYSHCSYYASLATETLQFPIGDLEKVLEGPECGLGEVEVFVRRSLDRSHGTALVIGNADVAGAAALVDVVDRAFMFAPLPPELRSKRESALIPLASSTSSTSSASSAIGTATATLAPSPSSQDPFSVPSAVEVVTSVGANVRDESVRAEKIAGHRLSHPEPNLSDDNSATTFYFQLPSRDPSQYLLVELLAQTLEQPFYNSLRTQQQLGYIVFSGVRSREGILSLVLTVQSAVVSADELARRVEAFVAEAVPSLARLSDPEFAAFVRGLVVRKAEPDQRLTGQASRFWSEIVAQGQGKDQGEGGARPLFDRQQQEVAILDKITKAKFLEFVNDFLPVSGRQRRLLISQVTSQKAQKNAQTSQSQSQSKENAAQISYIDIVDELSFNNVQPRV